MRADMACAQSYIPFRKDQRGSSPPRRLCHHHLLQLRSITETSRFSDALFNIVSSAKEHIHLQFYIFEDDEFGRRLRDLLVAKAKQGVEVRLIYDSVGCWKVSKEFFESMRCSGVYVECFLKVRFPILSNRFNYRNHRKVVVVDGKVGMVGGCNIADRYLKGISGGAWRDTMLLLKGAAVYGLQASFQRLSVT